MDGIGPLPTPEPKPKPKPKPEPTPTPTPGGGYRDPLIGKLPVPRKQGSNIERVGARLSGPVADGGRRQPRVSAYRNGIPTTSSFTRPKGSRSRGR